MVKRIFRLTGFRLGLILTLLFCALKLLSTTRIEWQQIRALQFLENLENNVLDLKFRVRGGPETAQERAQFQDRAQVVIVAVDEKSHRMEDLGLWPWPRVKVATLIRNLVDCDARVVGFDMVFSEPDISRAAPLIQSIEQRYADVTRPDPEFVAFLEQFEASANGDLQMARVLEDTKRVVLGYFFFDDEEEAGQLDQAEVVERGIESIGFGTFSFIKAFPGASVLGQVPRAYGVRANLPQFTEAVEHYGFFNQSPDVDGVYRTVPMVYAFVRPEELAAVQAGKSPPDLFPSLSLQVLALYYGKSANLYINTLDGVEEWRDYVGVYFDAPGPPSPEAHHLPLEHQGRFRVSYYGRGKTFRHISAGDVIHKTPAACKAVAGKIVLVGATTVGIYDLRPTAFEHSFPGVEIHASVIENVLTGNYLTRPYAMPVLEAFGMLLVGLLFCWLLNRFRLTIGLVLTLLVIGGLAALDYFWFFNQGTAVYMVLPLLQIFTLFIGIAVWRYATEERQKRETRRAFQYYLSAEVIDSVLQDTSKLGLGGERRELTVLFSDIRGFTTISEKLPPEELTALLNEYLTPMTDLVFKFRGTLDKYMGDAIMAFYGAPIAFPDHPRAACWTALEMMEELGKMRVSWRERGLPDIDIGIGVNTGMMSVGNMGSVTRFDYTVMGDHVNLGSRLEGLNKQYGTHIIVSQFTRAAIGDHFTCRELDSVAVKGKKEPVQIFELVHRGPAVAEQDAWIERFSQALAAYRAQQWDRATELFEAIAAERQDVPARMYIQRCQDMRANPPGEGWDGVFKMTTK
jgi:adenylate cyclase